MAKKITDQASPAVPEQGMTIEGICRAVAADFKRQGISQQDAADKLGLEKRAVSNQISGKRPFARKTAKLYSMAFGYNEDFLVKGKGQLFDEGPDGVAAQTVTITLKKYTELIRENAELKAILQAAQDSSPSKNPMEITTVSSLAQVPGLRTAPVRGRARLTAKQRRAAGKKGEEVLRAVLQAGKKKV